MEQANASDHLQQLVASLFANSWWLLRGHHTPAAPQRGFMPGTALADLCFTLFYKLFLQSIQGRLVDLGFCMPVAVDSLPLFSVLDGMDQCSQTDILWVDDTVICAACHSTADIVPIAERIASIAFSDLRRFGFTPNTKRGKTQVMPIILGPDTPAVASKIYVEDKSEIKVRDLHGNDYTICVGMSYKHLGS